MPLYKQTELDARTRIGLWHITEDLSFFETALAPGAITHETKRKQWYASRLLANEISANSISIVNHANGKPVIENSNTHISISHTQHMAAVILSSGSPVGIDIEMVHPKVERIAHKFLSPEELANISDVNRIEKLILYWSAKESMYKLFGKGGLEFKTQLSVDDFILAEQGTIHGRIIAPDYPDKKMKLHYSFLENHVLTYVVGL